MLAGGEWVWEVDGRIVGINLHFFSGGVGENRTLVVVTAVVQFLLAPVITYP